REPRDGQAFPVGREENHAHLVWAAAGRQVSLRALGLAPAPQRRPLSTLTVARHRLLESCDSARAPEVARTGAADGSGAGGCQAPPGICDEGPDQVSVLTVQVALSTSAWLSRWATMASRSRGSALVGTRMAATSTT